MPGTAIQPGTLTLQTSQRRRPPGPGPALNVRATASHERDRGSHDGGCERNVAQALVPVRAVLVTIALVRADLRAQPTPTRHYVTRCSTAFAASAGAPIESQA
jgi:hypothetical protein